MPRPRRAPIRRESLHVQVAPEVYAALVDEATRDNTTLTDVVQRALAYYQAHAPSAVPSVPLAVPA